MSGEGRMAGGAVRVRVRALGERLRASLFFLPMVGVVAAIGAGAAALAFDQHVDRSTDQLPLGLVSTVDGARALLSTIAGATITFAGIAFSVSLLTIQQASSQYSPRVVHTLFRDPFNKRVMALVVATFTFCVVVLRSVRAPLEPNGDPFVPNLSVGLAGVLGILTILATVAFIDHSAHSMDVSEILERVRAETIERVRQTWRHAGSAPAPAEATDGDRAAATTLRFTTGGWIQQIDYDAVLEPLEPGATLVLDTRPGHYAIAGTVLAVVSPSPDDVSRLERAVNAAVATGTTRTAQQDASYGLRQLADVALKALSPGVNDPTTAQDAIFHLAAVLAEMLRRDPPQPTVVEREDRRLIATQQPAPPELVHRSFDEIRRAASSQPAVCAYLLEALDLVAEVLRADGLAERVAPLAEQARLVVEGCRGAGLLPSDLLSVEEAYQGRFGAAT